MPDLPRKSQIKIGKSVSIETKQDQRTGKLTKGIVESILTSSESHPHGIKVQLKGGQVGRVKNVDKKIESSQSDIFVNLDQMKIPKTEDKFNEFKEFYQFDKKFPDMLKAGKKDTVENIKYSVQERFAIVVCSFGNDQNGGFVYLGIRSDGVIVGLEQDKEFGNFSDYNDSFANHIRESLGRLLNDKVFITSKLQIRFRNIDGKTICITQVLPSKQPLYLHSKEKIFYVRGPTPRAEKLDAKEQFRYIKERFPEYN